MESAAPEIEDESCLQALYKTGEPLRGHAVPESMAYAFTMGPSMKRVLRLIGPSMKRLLCKAAPQPELLVNFTSICRLNIFRYLQTSVKIRENLTKIYA